MLEDVIKVQLGLPGLVVLEARESSELIEVATQYGEEEAACPRCQRPTWQVHEWRKQRKRDARLWGKTVWIVLGKRRFRCRTCRCVFTEGDPACGRRRRTTLRLRRQVAKEAQEATVEGRVALACRQRRAGAAQTYLRPARRYHQGACLPGLGRLCVRRPGVMWTGLWEVLKSRAYGYRNDRTFSLRVLNLFPT